MSEFNRPGYRPHFSLVDWASWHAGRRARELFDEFRESWRAGWKARQEQSNRKPDPQPTRDHPREIPKDRPLLKVLFVCLPIIAAVILFPHDWFLNPVAIGLLQVLFWWVLLVPARHAPSFVRKILKIVVMTGVVFDFEVLIIWFNDYAPQPLRLDPNVGVTLALIFLAAWWAAFFWILFSRPRGKRHPVQISTQPVQSVAVEAEPVPELRIPRIRFADVGVMEEAKEQIREVVESRLNPDKYAAYGVVRNGILLYGPRGSGKTFLAEATAGEFKLNYHYVSPTKLMSMWMSESERNLRGAFSRALRNRPALLFIDEIDAMGATRQNLGNAGDPGGARAGVQQHDDRTHA